MNRDLFTRREHLSLLTRLVGAAAVSSIPFPFASAREKNDATVIQIFSKHLQWLDYEAMADAVKEMGFDGIDLTVRPDGHVLPENVEKDLPKAVAAIRKRGLLLQCITTAITGADEPFTEAILRTAASLEITRYRMGWISYDKNQDMLTNLEGIRQRLTRLAALNKTYGLRADYQNHTGDNFGSNPWELWYVLKDLPVEFIASRFDVRHAMVEGYQSWVNDFRLLSSFIRTLDFKDFKWTADGQIKNVPLGQGLVDFAAYAGMLKSHGVTAPITIHCEYDLGGAQEGRKDINMKPEQILQAIKRDLIFLRGVLS